MFVVGLLANGFTPDNLADRKQQRRPRPVQCSPVSKTHEELK
jgi:hypothetical protein